MNERTIGRVLKLLLALGVSWGMAPAPALAATCCAPPTGMVSWFPGDGTAEDVRGGHDGTLQNGATFAQGKVGQAFSFDGVDDFVSVPAAAALDLGSGSGLTIDAWISPTLSLPSPLVEWKASPGHTFGAHFWISASLANSLFVNLVDTGGSYHTFSSGSVLTLGVYQHVALTYDRGSGVTRLYRNGVVVAEQNLGSFQPDTSQNLLLGRRDVPGDERVFNGAMDEIELHDRALSPAEIQSIYEAGTAGKCSGQLCSTPPPGLVSWYRGQGNAVDSQGANDGTVIGATFVAQGKAGDAFSFDGVDDRIDIGDLPALRFTGTQVSLEAWIKPAAADPSGGVIVGKTRSGANEYLLFLAGGTGDLAAGVHEDFISSGFAPPANVWTHVAMTYDGAFLRLFANGSLVASAPTSGNLQGGTSPIAIGGRPDDDLYFDGLIDEVGIFNRTLTPTEIKEIFIAGTAGECADCAPQPPGLVAGFAGNGDASDSSGHANNGTLRGGATASADGMVGQTFGLNGTDADVRVPASPSLDVGTGPGLSIELWVKPDEVSSAVGHPFVEWNDAGNYAVLLWQFNNPGELFANIVDTTGSSTGSHYLESAPNILTAGQFQHVAVTYDKASGVGTLYRNGVVVASANLGSFTPQTAFDLFLGSHPDGGGGIANFYPGLLDEVHVFSRALSGAEIERIYRAGSRGTCPCAASGQGTLAFSTSHQVVSESAGLVTVTVRRTGGSNGPASIDYTTVDLAAKAAGDYSPTTGSLSWAAGDAAPKSFTVAITGDSVGEVSENFKVTLSNPGCGSLGLANQTITINDNDPGVMLVAGVVQFDENVDPQAVVQVTRTTGDISAALDLPFATANNSALAGSDYTGLTSNLHWNASEGGIKTINVNLINDSLAEKLEAFQVNLGAPSVGNIVGSSVASVRIVANDPGVLIVNRELSVSEAAGSVQLLVRRVGPLSASMSVDFATGGGSAVVPGDYASIVGTLNWAANDSIDKPINITLNNDSNAEPTEMFKVTLSNPVGGTLQGPAIAFITITDNDPGAIMAVRTLSVSEGAGSVTVSVQRLSGDISGTLSVNYTTVNRSASASQGDFTLSAGSVSWAAGEGGLKDIVVPIVDDVIDEADETFALSLTTAAGGTVASPSSTEITILDNDP